MDLPPSLGAALRPALPDLAEEMIAAIGREVPDYRRPLRGPFGRALRMAVENALTRFVDSIESPAAPVEAEHRGTYVALGVLEFQAGRSLDALQSAYRLGARLAWERFVEVAAADHDPEVMFKLAAAIFNYIDRISAESVEGYTSEQSASQAQRGRRRAALTRMLASGDAGSDELRALAQEAAWPRPAKIAALVTATDDIDRLTGRLGSDVLGIEDAGLTVLFVPDPGAPRRRSQLAAVIAEGAYGVLGPTVALERAHLSLARARSAHALIADGRLSVGDGELVVAADHLVELLVHGDPALAAELAASALAPLLELKAGARARLTQTLAAWLDNPGQISRIAAQLHVHPQTVRYRVAQLRELFGDRLEDSDARFELQLAVRATTTSA